MTYDDTDIKYRGEVILNTGSFEGDVYIKTNNNNMVIGKSTIGISISGSDGVSRFVTGSAGEIIDLGFTVTDEEGNVTLTNTGDGIHVDSNNYWYTSGHFKIGDADNFIDWKYDLYCSIIRNSFLLRFLNIIDLNSFISKKIESSLLEKNICHKMQDFKKLINKRIKNYKTDIVIEGHYHQGETYEFANQKYINIPSLCCDNKYIKLNNHIFLKENL